MLIALGSCSKPSTTVSSGLRLPSSDPLRQLRRDLRQLAEVVEDDEALWIEGDPLGANQGVAKLIAVRGIEEGCANVGS